MNKPRDIALLIIGVIGLNCAFDQVVNRLFVSQAWAGTVTTDDQLQRLLASEAALLRAQTDYQTRLTGGELSDTETIDFSEYIVELRKQVWRDCQALERRGYDISQQLSCQQTQATVPATGEPATAQTRGEQVQQQDGELSKQLGEFDEMMLQEQARIKASIPSSSGLEGEGIGNGNGEGDVVNNQQSNPGAAQTGEDREQAGDQSVVDASAPGAGATKPQQQPVTFPEPPNTPSGSDDDLVARQLREAAEQEADPELRARLWNEYKKYKQGI